MRYATAVVLLLGVIGHVSEATRRRDLLLHERLSAVPATVANLGPAPPDQTLRLRIALAPGDSTALERNLYAVSTPGSPQYGKHLSKREADALVAPSAESTSAVTSWLASNDVSFATITPAGDWLGINVMVSQANALFGANFSTFSDRSSGKNAVRTKEYSIPASLKGHIDFVHPTVMIPGQSFSRSRSSLRTVTSYSSDLESLSSRSAIPAECNVTVTPDCLQSMYGVPLTQATQSSNTLAVVGLVGEIANITDIQLFLKTYRPDLNSSAVPSFISIDGGITTNPDGLPAGKEAVLDLEWTMGVASNVPVTFISAGGAGGAETDVDIFNSILAEENPPHVVTTSYSLNEPQVSVPLMQKLCNMFGQLGTRGTTVIFSSGDGGVQGGGNVPECTTFVATFPSGCPYVTSVGATAFIPPGEIPFPFSSGGFSNVFPTPAFQKNAVQAYLKTLGNTYAGLYNASGRGYPDLAVAGVDMALAFDGEVGNGGGGTSFSAPIIASIVALLNDELLSEGRSPVGWLNPLIYQAPDAFNDLKSGHMTGCNTDGFNATAGWDPASGLGSPVYDSLRKAIGLR